MNSYDNQKEEEGFRLNVEVDPIVCSDQCIESMYYIYLGVMEKLDREPSYFSPKELRNPRAFREVAEDIYDYGPEFAGWGDVSKIYGGVTHGE